MPLEIKGYRVFIASPGGLEEERRAFRDTFAEYNAAEAIHDNVQFYPVGWEDTLAGIGRPQALINEDVRKCDFFVLLLWDRWGSDPGGGSAYTSGTEEEFNIALECYRDDSQPMRQIVVLFKAVDPRQLSDPGGQLSKVLEFKRTLEKEKQHLYQTFDTLDSFRVLLRRYLGAWLRLREEHAPPPLASSPNLSLPRELPVGSGADVNELIQEAVRLAGEGKPTDAEALFARATVGRIDPHAFISYASFLYRDGRVSQALTLLEGALEAARMSGASAIEADALRTIGTVLYAQGELNRAEQMYLNALEIDERLERLEGQADDHRNLGAVHFTRGDLDRAEEVYRKALEIDERLGRLEGQAAVYGNLGLVFMLRGNLDAAEQIQRAALEIHQRLENLDGQADDFRNIGTVLLKRGDLDGAEQMYRKALEIDEQRGRVAAQAKDYGSLGNVLARRGDLDGAEQMYRKTLEIDERLEDLEGQATAYGNIGVVLVARGDFDGAQKMYLQALEIDERLGKLEGQTRHYRNLGLVLSLQGDSDSAEQMFRKHLQIEEYLRRPLFQACACKDLGDLLVTRGDHVGAEQMYRKGVEIEVRAGIDQKLSGCRAGLAAVETTRRSAPSKAVSSTSLGNRDE